MRRPPRRAPRPLRATRFGALEPIRQGVRRCFGAFARGIAAGLAVRHDHGSQHMSDAFQKELRRALLEFRDTHNATWLIERHGFSPPSAVRQDRLSTAALAA